MDVGHDDESPRRMTETKCRYDRDTGDYLLPDGEKCDVPRREHCMARKTCPVHLGWGELTCARCLGRTRADIRAILDLASLMLPEAMVAGVNSRAASLAGPAGDPLVLSWRRVNAVRGGDGPVGDGTEETDPTEVLGIWQAMLSEDYGHDLPDRITLASAAAYLERNLNRVAQDEAQDFPLMARELRKCRATLEAVIHNSMNPDRGVTCPACLDERLATGKVGDKEAKRLPKLVRRYPHWCDDPECCREHFDTDAKDVWVCPKNPEHWWEHHAYENWLQERRGA
jgi:hypothetical protein